MPAPLVYIILLNYNNFKDTIECFISLKNITYQNYNIVIIDNNSPDNSMRHLKEYMDDYKQKYIFYNSNEDAISSSTKNTQTTLIQSGNNGGYGYGNNIGIKYALKNNAEYILVLNNDTIVDKHFLEPLVEKCENDDKIGIVSGKIFFYDKPETIWFNGGKYTPLTASVKHFNINEKDKDQNEHTEITFISGCMMLIPRKVLKKVGLFNEEYFMYYEDLEYSQRVINNGFIIKISKNSKIWHKVSRNSDRRFSDQVVYYRSRNYILFVKNFHKYAINILFITIAFFFSYGKRLIINKHPIQIRSLIRGILNGLRSNQ